MRPAVLSAFGSSDGRYWIALSAAGIVLFVAWHLWALPRLGITLHVDEAQYWAWSRELAWGYYSKPPALAALIAASTHLWGDDLLGVKALPLVLTALTAVALGGWVTSMSGDVRRGGLAVLIALASPLLLVMGFAATTDGPLLLAWVLAAWALWLALQQPSSLARWALVGALLGLGLLAKYTMLAFIPGALWAAVRVWPTQRPWSLGVRGAAIAGLTALAIVAPHGVWNLEAGWPTLRHTADITVLRQSASIAHGVATFALGQLVLLGPLTLALLHRAGPRCPIADRRHPSGERFAWALGTPLLVLGLVQAARGGANVNWAAPALLSLMAWWALRAPLQGGRTAGWLGAQALLVAALLHAPSVAQGWGQDWPPALDFWRRMRGWDAAWAALERQLPVAPRTAVIGSSRTVLAHGRYAWRHHPLAWYAWDPQRQGRYHDAWRHGLDAERLQALLRQTDRPVWLIGTDPQDGAELARTASVRVEPLTHVVWQGATARVSLWAWQVRPIPGGAP
ncbi:MAG: glycosyltransferase family 39 protein [Tepidimonas sp.]|uniref:glycosyltransferase family 39 protein n=1 Tax=Tepidimonas sp. TaxID=2002775 RepID=UPI00298F0A67|nr:glycosyltransferase family 39 protein [Tepidimonas sp.]MDW8336646.1 glycosyltransferase family 39 protein [Tepidimonas sp.]